MFWYSRGLCLVDTGDTEELFVCDSWNTDIHLKYVARLSSKWGPPLLSSG